MLCHFNKIIIVSQLEKPEETLQVRKITVQAHRK